jgi:ABC-type lipoprotein export system ATPase subunit
MELVSITKIYPSGRDRVMALKHITFPIYAGDYVSIVGPSGAGKSTLLHIMGGLEFPTEGRVTFRGRDIYQMGDKELSLWRSNTIGFTFQFYHLIEELNVCENVALAAFIRERKHSFKKAQELLKYLGIDGRKDFFPSQLSGGEKQKVALARALINEPLLILCDEPTGNLDRESQHKIMELLYKLNTEKKKTVVVVTHNLELAQKAKRTLFIKNGEIK